jgi:hypothetical protein
VLQDLIHQDQVVDADISLVKPLPCTEQFEKRGHAVPPQLSETTHGAGMRYRTSFLSLEQIQQREKEPRRQFT